MRKFLVGLALLASLGACDVAQNAVDDAGVVCKDGVEYFSITKISTNGVLSFSVVPHFKPNGSLYTCVRKAK